MTPIDSEGLRKALEKIDALERKCSDAWSGGIGDASLADLNEIGRIARAALSSPPAKPCAKCGHSDPHDWNEVEWKHEMPLCRSRMCICDGVNDPMTENMDRPAKPCAPALRYPKGSVVPEWNHYCADGHEPVASMGDRCPVCHKDADGRLLGQGEKE